MTLNLIMSVFFTDIFYNVRFCTPNAQMILYLEPQIGYIFIAIIIFKTFQTNLLPLLTQNNFVLFSLGMTMIKEIAM